MKKFSKILAAAAALAMVSVFASCGDPDDLTARTTVDADDSGEAVSYVEIKDLTSYIVADAWNSGTTISASAPYTITEGTKWDPSGMISVPFSFDAGVLADCDFIVVNIDTSNVNLRPTEGSNYSIELKVEVPEGANKAAKCLDGTNLVKNNKIVFDIRKISFKADAPQFMLSLRGTGTAVLTSVKGAKADKAPALPPADDGEPLAVLLDEVWSENWNTKTFDAALFANVTNDTVISMEVSKDTDKLITTGEDGNPNYSECYAIIQLINCSEEGKFGAGTAEGATITATPQLEGMFQDSDTNTNFYTVTYKPTSEEWENIKTNGMGIQAHGVMFKKIELK